MEEWLDTMGAFASEIGRRVVEALPAAPQPEPMGWSEICLYVVLGMVIIALMSVVLLRVYRLTKEAAEKTRQQEQEAARNRPLSGHELFEVLDKYDRLWHQSPYCQRLCEALGHAIVPERLTLDQSFCLFNLDPASFKEAGLVLAVSVEHGPLSIAVAKIRHIVSSSTYFDGEYCDWGSSAQHTAFGIVFVDGQPMPDKPGVWWAEFKRWWAPFACMVNDLHGIREKRSAAEKCASEERRRIREADQRQSLERQEQTRLNSAVETLRSMNDSVGKGGQDG